MNFKPEKVYFIKDASGKDVRVEQWDYNTRSGVELIESTTPMFLFLILFPIFPALLLYGLLMNSDRRRNYWLLLPLLASVYIVYDFRASGILLSAANIILPEVLLRGVVMLNISVIFMSLLFLLFGPSIHRFCCHFGKDDVAERFSIFWQLFVSVGVGVMFFAHLWMKINVPAGWNTVYEAYGWNGVWGTIIQ